ncbi:hypothetical protein, partial [Enterobacter roggenkampii]
GLPCNYGFIAPFKKIHPRQNVTGMELATNMPFINKPPVTTKSSPFTGKLKVGTTREDNATLWYYNKPRPADKKVLK